MLDDGVVVLMPGVAELVLYEVAVLCGGGCGGVAVIYDVVADGEDAVRAGLLLA